MANPYIQGYQPIEISSSEISSSVKNPSPPSGGSSAKKPSLKKIK